MVPDKITIHCSDSPNGRAVSTAEIKQWHTDPPPKGRGWKDIGYHAVIEIDGGCGKGRQENVTGAHVEGHNEGNLGICLVGTNLFHRIQFSSAELIIRQWMIRYGITLSEVYCHYMFDTAIKQGKSCPNIKIEDIKPWLAGDPMAIEEYILGDL